MDAENLFEQDPMQPNPVGEIRDTQAGASQKAGAIGIAEDTIAHAKSLTARFLGVIAMHQPRKVQSELVSIALGIWALDLAQLALETGVQDPGGIRRGDLSNIAVVLFVE